MSEPPSGSIRLRVAAWNILRSELGTPEQFAAVLKPFDLDVIAFTEVPKGDWTARAADALGMPHHVIGTLSSGGEQHDWGRDKYKAIVSRHELGPMSDVYPKNPSDWLNGSATRAVASIDGIAIAIYSLHIPGFVDEDSVAEALGKHLTTHEPTRRVVAMGDYNDATGNPGLVAYESYGMRATWSDLGTDLSKVFSVPANNPDATSGKVIDHIYYRPADGARAVDGGVIEVDPPLSDHKPVWAEIIFER